MTEAERTCAAASQGTARVVTPTGSPEGPAQTPPLGASRNQPDSQPRSRSRSV